MNAETAFLRFLDGSKAPEQPRHSWPRRSIPLHPEDEQALIALYKCGLRYEDIARKLLLTLNVTQQHITRLMQEGRLGKRRRPPCPKRLVVYHNPRR